METLNVIESAPKWAAKIMANYIIERGTNMVTVGAMERFLAGEHSMEGAFANAVFEGNFKKALRLADSGNKVVLRLLQNEKQNFVNLYSGSESDEIHFFGADYYRGYGQQCGTEFQKRESHKSTGLYLFEAMFY